METMCIRNYFLYVNNKYLLCWCIDEDINKMPNLKINKDPR